MHNNLLWREKQFPYNIRMYADGFHSRVIRHEKNTCEDNALSEVLPLVTWTCNTVNVL